MLFHRIPLLRIVCICFVLIAISISVKSLSPTQQIQKNLFHLAESVTNDNLTGFLSLFDPEVISMPEYQPTLQGKQAMSAYFSEIFIRQHIQHLSYQTHEIIKLDEEYLLESGTFEKKFQWSEHTDSLINLPGKYLHLWKIQNDGSLKIKVQAFGYHQWIQDPSPFFVKNLNPQPDLSDPTQWANIPFELRAANALGEKYVHIRNGQLRSGFYDHDAVFMPFASHAYRGIYEITNHLNEYSSGGNVTIDTVSVQTLDFNYFQQGERIVELITFYVEWTTPEGKGKSTGKGLRLWRRQPDKSIKIYREIGVHNHIN